MSQRLDSPIPQHAEAWIELPDEWLGKHAALRDEAVESANEQGLGGTLGNFAVSLALLDNWSLPGLNGPPEKWDFESLPLSIITWVNGATITPFLAASTFPQLSSMLSLNGLKVLAETQSDGSSEEE